MRERLVGLGLSEIVELPYPRVILVLHDTVGITVGNHRVVVDIEPHLRLVEIVEIIHYRLLESEQLYRIGQLIGLEIEHERPQVHL